jgi:dsDNA-specific endonuclease/ATPase MutS2
MTASNSPDEDALSPQPADDAVVHLRRALEIADRTGLPPHIAARVQEAIDACLALEAEGLGEHGGDCPPDREH